MTGKKVNKNTQITLEGFTLEDLENEAIEFLQQHEPPEGYFVGFSGGKDSIVTLELCKLAKVKHEAYFTFTTIDPPDICKFIKTHYPEVKWIRPKKSFFSYLQSKAPPMRMQRWCCQYIKEKPSWSIPLNKRVFGIRAEESSTRAKRGRISEQNIKKGVVHTSYKPIFNWKEWAVWAFIEHHNLPYPSLYDEGVHRVGCILCPYIFSKAPGATKKRTMLQARYPGQWKAFKHSCKRWFMRKYPLGVDKFGLNFDEWYEMYTNGLTFSKRGEK